MGGIAARRSWRLLKKSARSLWFTLTLFRVGGVPVQIHSTTLVFPCSVVAGLAWHGGGWLGLALGMGVLVVVYASVLIHELAHVRAARQFGCGTRAVLFIPFGGVALLEEFPREPYEIWVALAGPLASATLGLMAFMGEWICSLIPCKTLAVTGSILGAIGIFNLCVAGFNLLPCYPMDGGRILRSLLAVVIGRACPRRAGIAHVLATRIAVRYVARILIIGIILLTILCTHLWHHLLLFLLLLLGGEAEYMVLASELEAGSNPPELRFIPMRECSGIRARIGQSACLGIVVWRGEE